MLGALTAREPRRLLGRPEAQDLAASRLPWLFGGMLLWALLIFGRLVYLQVIDHKRYQVRAENQHTTKLPIRPIRGELRDRLGESLAISIEVESLFVTPQDFYPAYRIGKGEERTWGEPDRKARFGSKGFRNRLEK